MFKQSCCASTLYAFHVVCILQQTLQTLCLMIDNRLTHPVNDCYSRVSIGAKLPDADIALRVDVTSLTECENNCSKYKNGCAAISFGVGIKGNSTCLISVRIPALEYFEVHPEYDVYVKKPQDSLWCEFGRTYGSLTHKSANAPAGTKKTSEKGPIRSTDTTELMPMSLSISLPYYKLLSLSHEKRIATGDYSHKPRGIISLKTDRIISTKSFATDCHEKIQPGKKMMGLLVERVISCENLQDCCRSCNYERSFVCKGFNHRHRAEDPRCVCELTSTPYFRMDVAEDFLADSQYDYYEKNEDCISSAWHAANDLPRSGNHMKYYGQDDRSAWLDLERANKDSFRESSTTTNRVYAHDYYPNGRVQSSDQINYEEPFGFTSSHDGLNWNRKWKDSTAVHDNTVPSRQRNYDREGPVESRPEYRRPIVESSVPNKNDNIYGRPYPYGGAHNQRTDYEQRETQQIPRRCSVKAVSGTRLNRGLLRTTYLAHSLSQCEDFCIGEASFSCESFAYRYSVLTTRPTDNCLLSDHSYQDLHFYTDLEPDRDYDVYVMMSDARICHSKKTGNRYPSEECFSRIKSGFTLPTDIKKKSLSVNDLGECQFACTRSREFVCNCFVYNYATPVHGSNHEGATSNCFLTDSPAEEINSIDMPDMDGAELYERSTFSYGCDAYPPAATIPNTIIRNDDGSYPAQQTDELCYAEHRKPCKLMSHAIVSSTRAIAKSECRERCSAMRNTGTIPCMSFDYTNPTATITAAAANVDGTRDNCFLSDISVRDLRPYLDYVHDNDHELYTWTDYDPRCNANAFDAPNEAPMPDKQGQKPSEIRYGYGEAYNPPSVSNPSVSSSTRWRSEHGPEEYDERYVKHSSINENGTPSLDSDTHGHSGQNLFYPRSQSSYLRRYTVNGHPCKNATVCQENQITGFWSCETEGEYGTWDYCCEPNHRCGYSKGYHRPWCYVGSNEDQWRPCSDTYYPYYSSNNRPTYRPSALYTGRHWPIIYFHEMLPPNCSISDPYASA